MHTHTAAIFLCASLVLSVRDGHGAPLPKTVGTTTLEFSDSRREEPWTATASDRRRLLVQFWYPASAGRVAGRGLHVIVFSHGMNSTRAKYTAFFEELASRGFVVAAVEHTYWSDGVTFADGTVVTDKDGMPGRVELTSDEIDQMMAAGVQVMAEDDAFVVERLRELTAGRPRENPFAGRLDLTRVGVFGHSMGGMAATRACLDYSAFTACLSLDGPFYLMHLQPRPSPKAFLLLLNSDWGRKSPARIRRNYLAAWENPTVAIVGGSHHNTFSDTVDERERAARSVIGSLVTAFFEANLAGRPVSVDAIIDRTPTVERVVLQTLTDQR
jgi:dienelactone hydrolase